MHTFLHPPRTRVLQVFKGIFRLIRVCATIILRCFKGAWLSNMYPFLHSPRTRVVQVFKGVFVFNMQCLQYAVAHSSLQHDSFITATRVFKGVFVFNMQCIKGAWLFNM